MCAFLAAPRSIPRPDAPESKALVRLVGQSRAMLTQGLGFMLEPMREAIASSEHGVRPFEVERALLQRRSKGVSGGWVERRKTPRTGAASANLN